MTQEQAVKLLSVIQAAYPRQVLGEDTIRVYAQMMLDIDYTVANKAVLQLLATSPWMPSIAEIRRTAAEIELKLPSVEEALVEVRRAVQTYNRYDPQPLRWSCEAIDRAVRAVGWTTLLDGEWTITSAQLRKAYESSREQALIARQTSLALPAPDRPLLPNGRG